MAAREVKSPMSARFIYEQVKTSGTKTLNRRPDAMEPAIPPIKPTRDLFGLAAIKPLLFLPNKIPKNQAAESHIKTNIKYNEIIYLESGKMVILERNVIKNPQ